MAASRAAVVGLVCKKRHHGFDSSADSVKEAEADVVAASPGADAESPAGAGAAAFLSHGKPKQTGSLCPGIQTVYAFEQPGKADSSA